MAVLYDASVVFSVVKGEVFLTLAKPSPKFDTPYGEEVENPKGRNLRWLGKRHQLFLVVAFLRLIYGKLYGNWLSSANYLYFFINNG